MMWYVTFAYHLKIPGWTTVKKIETDKSNAHKSRWIHCSNVLSAGAKKYLLLVEDGNDSSSLLGEAGEHWHGQVEMMIGRIAPPSGGPRRAEVGGGNSDHTRKRVAPATRVWAIRIAPDHKTSSARVSSLKERGAQCRRVHSIAHGVRVFVSTSSTYSKRHQFDPSFRNSSWTTLISWFTMLCITE